MVYKKVWDKVGKGKFYKRAYNRAARRAAKGTGKASSVANCATEIGYGKHRAASNKPAS